MISWAAARPAERTWRSLADTTPTAVVTDFKIVQQLCDGVLLVVRPDHTNRTALRKTIESEAQDKLLGIVINAVDDWFLWKSQQSYSYYYQEIVTEEVHL